MQEVLYLKPSFIPCTSSFCHSQLLGSWVQHSFILIERIFSLLTLLTFMKHILYQSHTQYAQDPYQQTCCWQPLSKIFTLNLVFAIRSGKYWWQNLPVRTFKSWRQRLKHEFGFLSVDTCTMQLDYLDWVRLDPETMLTTEMMDLSLESGLSLKHLWRFGLGHSLTDCYWNLW